MNVKTKLKQLEDDFKSGKINQVQLSKAVIGVLSAEKRSKNKKNKKKMKKNRK